MTASSPSRNRIDTLFEGCRAKNRAALILYLTCGFPNAAITRRILPVLADSGADLIELGVPFSDPIADGPTIQRSSTIALNAGMTFPGTLDILRDFRVRHQTPAIIFGALNPYYARGLEQSARMAAEAGADGILAADLPVEEAAEFKGHLANQGLHLITLIAPTSPRERVRQIAASASGFIYCISMKGTTGAAAGLQDSVRDYVATLRAETTLPLALGFGISRPEHVRQAVATGVDGVVVGSALITLIEETLSAGKDLEKEVGAYVRSLASALGR